MPHFAGKKRYGHEIRNDYNKLKEKLVLPYLVLNNPGHIITLCESWNFAEFNSLCVEYSTIAIQCLSDKPDHAPPLAFCLKTPYGMIEILHHWDVSKAAGSKTDGWLIHGAIARCIFGQRTHDIDTRTRERVEHRDVDLSMITHLAQSTGFVPMASKTLLQVRLTWIPLSATKTL